MREGEAVGEVLLSRQIESAESYIYLPKRSRPYLFRGCFPGSTEEQGVTAFQDPGAESTRRQSDLKLRGKGGCLYHT